MIHSLASHMSASDIMMMTFCVQCHTHSSVQYTTHNDCSNIQCVFIHCRFTVDCLVV